VSLPLLVLFATAAFASFALVVSSGIERGQLAASWLEVGADYRVEGPSVDASGALDPGRIEGVEAVASAYLDPGAVLETGRFSLVRIRLEAIEPAAYERVARGALAPDFPTELHAPPGADPGSGDEPIPAIVSRVMPSAAESVAPGDTLIVRFGAERLAFRVVAVRDSVPGLVADGPFLVAPLAHLAAALGQDASANVLFIRAPAEAATGIAAAVAGQGSSDTTVASRHAWLTELRSSPMLGVVADGFIAALVLAVAYATIAIVTSVVLVAARRNQDLAFLRSIGLSQRQAGGIMVVEHGLPILLAVVPGLITGIAIAALLERDLGLDAFLGDVVPYRTQVDWQGTVGVAGLLVLIVAVSISIGTAIARRARTVDALRVGEL
jgi:putative ABC transport system permease protein